MASIRVAADSLPSLATRKQTCADAEQLFLGDVEYIRESLDSLNMVEPCGLISLDRFLKAREQRIPVATLRCVRYVKRRAATFN